MMKQRTTIAIVVWRLMMMVLCCCSLVSALQQNTQRIPQTLLLREPHTGILVHLVGTMHYNPHSVTKVASIVSDYGKSNRLGSLVVESCPLRWKLMHQKHPKGSMLHKLLNNEFQAASEAAAQYLLDESQTFVPVLADEDIDANDQKINEMVRSSVEDYFDPLGGGWTRIGEDLLRGYGESIDPAFLDDEHEAEYLEWSYDMDPELAGGTPTSLARYALSTMVRKPVKGTLLLVWISTLVYLIVTRVAFLDGGIVTIGWSSVYGFLLSLSLGIPLLGRVFLFALLGERNTILANNIRNECLRMANKNHNQDESSSSSESPQSEDQVCVVIMGLAHCNGVKRELLLNNSCNSNVM